MSPGAESAIESPLSYNDGTWHHLVATQGTSGMKLYVDGQSVVSNSTVNAQSYTGYWRVGGDNLTGRASRPTSDYFAGNIDEVAVYPRVLSTSEVQTHFSKAGGVLPNVPPTANFTSTAVGKNATFDGSGSSDSDGTVASYAWDFGDGTTGTGVSPTHHFAIPGDHSVTLTVTDNSGASSTPVTKTVTVTDAAPTAAFTSSTNNLTATFDGTGSSDSDGSVASYAWDFGDGTNGTGANPSHDYATAGTYHVSLTVTDDDNVASAPVVHDVIVSAPGTVASDDFARTVTNGWAPQAPAARGPAPARAPTSQSTVGPVR